MELKVITLNCWGLAIVSKNRIPRIQAIGEVLASSSYDVVCLQELWVKADYELIRDKVKGVLPYSHYFFSGVAGSGVCILSKHPITDAFFHQWPVNGYIHKLHHGDWFGGKGVGLCRLRVHNSYNVNVYSAHLHAEYDRDCDEYQAHRVLQAFDTAQFIQLTSQGADLSLLGGDLNTEPGDLAHRIIMTIPGLMDAYYEAGEQVLNIQATYELPSNSYTPSRSNNVGKRIDYVMYHSGAGVEVMLKSYALPLPEKVPESAFSYSDHEAVAVTLLARRNEGNSSRCDSDELKRAVLEESMDVCEQALNSLANQKWLYWFFSFVLLIMFVVTLATSMPSGYDFVYHILKIIVTLTLVYTVVMATIWNKIERHAVIAGQLSMEIMLKNYNKSTSGIKL